LLFPNQGQGNEPVFLTSFKEHTFHDYYIENDYSNLISSSRLIGGELTVEPLKQMKQNLVLLMGSSMVAIFIIEALLRGIGIPAKLNSGWGWENSAGRKLSQYDDLTTNQFGYRGQNINYHTNDYVVLLVGDSQVEAYAGRPEHMPERFLQESLSSHLNKPVKVVSLAASG